MFDYGIKINTTQCDPSDFVTIEPVEIKGREFPMEKNEILEALKDENLHAVRTMLNYKCQAWCLFSVEDGNLVIHRLSAKNLELLHDIMTNLFDTITTGPRGTKCTVTMYWPEYETDHWLFEYLRGTGWRAFGLLRDRYEAYGQKWDAVQLVRVFN